MRIAVISDIHGNLEALTQVIGHIEGQNIDQIYCLGDMVGYGPNPKECLDILMQRIPSMKLEVKRTRIDRKRDQISCQRISYERAYIPPVVKGNHEEGATNPVFLEDRYEFSRRARETLIWTSGILTSEEHEWLKMLPYALLLRPQHNGARGILLAHAEWTVPEEFHYLVADDNDTLGFENMMGILENDILFCGHTHEQAVHLKDGWKVPPAEQRWEYAVGDEPQVIVNPGSVGQSRVTNHGEASYAIYDTENDKVTFHRIPYDYQKTIKKIMALPCPPITMKTKQSLTTMLRGE